MKSNLVLEQFRWTRTGFIFYSNIAQGAFKAKLPIKRGDASNESSMHLLPESAQSEEYFQCTIWKHTMHVSMSNLNDLFIDGKNEKCEKWYNYEFLSRRESQKAQNFHWKKRRNFIIQSFYGLRSDIAWTNDESILCLCPTRRAPRPHLRPLRLFAHSFTNHNMRTDIEYALPIAIAEINQMRLHSRRRRERLISQFQRYQHIHTLWLQITATVAAHSNPAEMNTSTQLILLGPRKCSTNE